MAELPAGTVTFLFTDIEGSTRLLKQLRDQYADLLTDQRRILRAAFQKYGGQEVDTQGDAFFVSFLRATEAVAAAVAIQKALFAHDWPRGVQVRVRMGLHTGEPLVAEEGYVGIDVHRAARIAQIGHGGQVLLSETTAALARNDLPEGVSIRDLGFYLIKDLEQPESINQLVIEGLPYDFPALASRQAKQPGQVLEPAPVSLPPFLREDVQKMRGESPVFVARDRELAMLGRFLDMALAGHGQVAFVTGGAGRGKTALMQAFSLRAQEAHPELIVASSDCTAYTGIGDPYLPFREILGMLTGDVETKWAAGSITSDHARRLWASIPVSTKVLVTDAPDLINVMVSGRQLVARVTTAAGDHDGWLPQLNNLAVRDAGSRSDLEQRIIFEQFALVLRRISDKCPILLLLDDLQWADAGSVNLLFHLGRRLEGARILLVGAYRAEEVRLGRDGERHPLESVLNEFKRQFGEVVIDLRDTGDQEGRQFVDALLDTEPNRLSPAFREDLFYRTGGHPLFTVELLRYLKERGDLIKDDLNRWTESERLDWIALPARVEGVIGERIGRLEDSLRGILEVACVEGETFTVQVIAAVLNVDELGLMRILSQELSRVHRLVQEQADQQIGQRRLARFRFSHVLIQRYLYDRQSSGERRFLHARVAAELEKIYDGNTEEIAISLAQHFSECADWYKTAKYLMEGGFRAQRHYGFWEAIQLYNRALDALEKVEAGHKKGQPDVENINDLRANLYSQSGQAYRRLGLVSECREKLSQALAFFGSPMPDKDWKFILGVAGQIGLQLALLPLPDQVVVRSGDEQRRGITLQMARNYSTLSDLFYFANETLPAIYVILRSLNLAERAGPSTELAEACAFTGGALGLIPLHNVARAYNRRANRIAQSLGAPGTIVRLAVLTSVYHLGLGDWDKVVASLEHALEICEQTGDRSQWGECTVNLANAHLLVGNTSQSIQLFNQLVEVTRSHNNLLQLVWGLEGQAHHALRKGNNEEAVVLLEEALDLLRENPDRISEIEVLGLLAVARLCLGELNTARMAAEAANEQLAQSSIMGYSLFQGLVGIADIYLELWARCNDQSRDPIECKRLAKLAGDACRNLHSFARVFKIGRPIALRYHGTLEWRRGKHRKALLTWRKSLESATRLGMPYEQGLAHYQIGVHLESDGPERELHLTQAIQIFELLEADYDLSEAKAALTRQ